MELKIVGDNEVPKRARKGESAFELTPVWKKLKAALDKGLPAKGESALLSFTEADLAEIGIGRIAIARFVQKYIAAKGLPLIVRNFSAEGLDNVRVSHPKDKRTRKR